MIQLVVDWPHILKPPIFMIERAIISGDCISGLKMILLVDIWALLGEVNVISVDAFVSGDFFCASVIV